MVLAQTRKNWPSDVLLITPDSLVPGPECLPPAWRTIQEALEWCTARAEQIPFKAISAETLTWKLAAIVQHACTGMGFRREHEFRSNELPKLFEQIVAEFHRLPDPPTPYRAQQGEPDFASQDHVRFVVGLSGAGKTAWASQASLHEPGHIAYFDGGDMPKAALAPSLARELAARLRSIHTFEVGRVFLPGSTGVQSLRALDTIINSSQINLIIVLDNVHLIEPADMVTVVKAIPNARWILLGQPWPGKVTVETRLGVRSEELGGWSIGTISQEFLDHHCSASPRLLERVRRLTGGFPLFVQDAAKLTEAYYNRNVEQFCSSLESRTNPEVTGQETILSDVYARLSATAAAATSVLVIADVPISLDEAAAVTTAGTGVSTEEARSLIRELVSWGVVQLIRDQRLILHDAFRSTAREGQQKVTAAQLRAAKERLADLIRETISPARTDRLRLFCKLLPEIDQSDTLIDLSSSLSEFFHEYGFAEEFTTILAEVVESNNLDVEDRFWAADTLVFWSLQSGNLTGIDSWLDTMESCIPHITDNATENFALVMKKMLIAAARGRPIKVQTYYSQARTTPLMSPAKLRILEYNYANCLFRISDYALAEKLLYTLIEEYYKVLGIAANDVILKKAIDIIPKLSAKCSIDDAKHLADTLDLTAQVLTAQGKPSGLCRIHACKFYAISDSISSAVRVGQDFVDESLSRNDLRSAREMFENMLLPLIRERKMLGHWVDVHSQYAVVLAYDGEVEQARTLMKSLEPMVGEDTAFRAQFVRQREIIEAVGQSKSVLPSSPNCESPDVVEAFPLSPPPRKVGRNQECPCGSGKKYKKCCGR